MHGTHDYVQSATMSWVSAPQDIVAAGLLWIVWGAGVALHAAQTFLWGGDWERREVERLLGRAL